MKAYILTIGDEILIGQITDTNAVWMAQQLNAQGIRVVGKSTVGDRADQIVDGIKNALLQADLVLMTGGLGATKDDITKKCIAQYFDVPMVWHQETFDRLSYFFKKMGRVPSEMNKNGCFMPENALILKNDKGLAPAMWFETADKKVLVSMPGVPFEMQHLMTDRVLPRLREAFPMSPIAHRTIMTAGSGETMLAEKLDDFENALPDNLKLAYLPSLGSVRLRLTATGDNQIDIENQLKTYGDALISQIGAAFYGENEISLARAIGQILEQKKLTMSTAESCTGGYVAHLITSESGSSSYFKGGVVAYDNQLKINQLGVDLSLIETDGAVSESVVKSMVAGACTRLKTDVAIAISGIAGPNGGTPDKPVGTVWIAAGNADRTLTQTYVVDRGRNKNIEFAAMNALNLLRRWLKER